MNYYIDTEFLEGTQKGFFRDSKPTIDLISIAIVAEDGREYYAISKDFNLKEAWNRFDLVKDESVGARIGATPTYKKVYWIRDNVLLPIYRDMVHGDARNNCDFTLDNMRWLIKTRGRSRKDIAMDVEVFTRQYSKDPKIIWDTPVFYGYYADYDWVALCWLYGKMVNLPRHFPMYCRDLKQMLDEKVESFQWSLHKVKGWPNEGGPTRLATFQEKLDYVKGLGGYPKTTNEHNAWADALWNKQLHEFIQKLHK